MKRSKEVFHEERTLEEIEANIDNLNTLIDESNQRQQDLIDSWHQESSNHINPETTDYERATRG